jgi:hypothetical protein
MERNCTGNLIEQAEVEIGKKFGREWRQNVVGKRYNRRTKRFAVTRGCDILEIWGYYIRNLLVESQKGRI